MTNFEKWKDGLTLKELAFEVTAAESVEVCNFCPAHNDCVQMRKAHAGPLSCEELVIMWGEQEAQDDD